MTVPPRTHADDYITERLQSRLSEANERNPMGLRRLGKVWTARAGTAEADFPEAALGTRVKIITRRAAVYRAEITEVGQSAVTGERSTTTSGTRCRLRIDSAGISAKAAGGGSSAQRLDQGGISPGDLVVDDAAPTITVSPDICGTMRNGYGEYRCRVALADPRYKYLPALERSVQPPAPNPMTRGSKKQLFMSGIRAIDSFCTAAEGQRFAVIAPPGVGKTRLVEDILSGCTAEIRVVALVGERSREIREFVDAMSHAPHAASTIVVATPSTASADERARAVEVATSYAEYFRHCGLRVVLVIDSLTRLARAWRDLALARGELPVRHGYPSSVFEQLPALLERAGQETIGSITAFYTLLAREELVEDPLVEEVCSITDGHIYLSRLLAQRGVYPAVDVSRSLSRLQGAVMPPSTWAAAARIRELVALYERDREVVQLASAENEYLSRLQQHYHVILDFLRREAGYLSASELYQEIEQLAQQLEAV